MDRGALGRVAWSCAARAQTPVDAASQPSDDDPRVDPSSDGLPPDGAPADDLAVGLPDTHRAVLRRALAAGHRPPTLRRLADHLRPVPADGLPALLDPLRRQLQQRSGTTCGSACLVTARAIADPVYALWLLDGFDARTGRRAGVGLAERFAAAERVVHRRTTALVLPDGHLQVPWPRALGTPPWGVATELTRIWAGAASGDGGGGRDGGGATGGGAVGDGGPVRFRTRLVDPDDEASRRGAAHALAAAVADGWVGAMVVGDGLSPRHVTLAVGPVAGEGAVGGSGAVGALGDDGPALAVYEPGCGQVVPVPYVDLVAGRAVLGGWDRLWAVVVPA